MEMLLNGSIVSEVPSRYNHHGFILEYNSIKRVFVNN
jgi:hypothetical protein